ncbi:endo-1,4-beta-xylanase (plasmid) [Rhizobium sp. CB3171]|uniref:endo-1,4-beta-xylanase n=1 Tax=Rhizobium sp. CB3171 TaxID=3039157 RepID=UPI0024B201CB|nr:endo-1,4-beta-xylanase [Rhizobium sp. CB3171]WFU07144.1 endo-1,4-beta-xylanase [Rhizobium sp. CB3171]
MPAFTRRSFMTVAAGVAAHLVATPTTAQGQRALRDAADKTGLLYGSAAAAKFLTVDEQYADLLAKQASILVCEAETKRKALQPAPDRYDFNAADTIFRFAQKNGQKMRGHTFVWHDAMPEWLIDALDQKPRDTIITDYISTVAKRYRGRVHSWDVVNEVINIEDRAPGFMRTSSPWYKAFGESYIDIAFHAAKQADPDAILFLNELNTEANERWSANIRKGTLDLLDRLLKRNVPVEAVGIQAHLKTFRTAYSDEVFSQFLDEIGSRGLKVMITEMDLADSDGPADPEQRDDAIASLAKRFLNVAFSKPHTLGCITWGITDKYSWLNSTPKYQRADGQLCRSLPFDVNYQPKRLVDTMLASYGLRAK